MTIESIPQLSDFLERQDAAREAYLEERIEDQARDAARQESVVERAALTLAINGGGPEQYFEAQANFLVEGSFDAASYLAANVDLQQAFGSDLAAANRHFVEFGANEFAAGSRASIGSNSLS